MKKLNKENLLKFMSNSENRLLIIWFCTLISYVVLFFLTDNVVVLLFSYFIFYLLYSKLFDFIYKKIKITPNGTLKK